MMHYVESFFEKSSVCLSSSSSAKIQNQNQKYFINRRGETEKTNSKFRGNVSKVQVGVIIATF